MVNFSDSPNFDVFFGKSPKGAGGSFSIQKISLLIFLVSKQYISVVNFGEKKSKKGGKGGTVHWREDNFVFGKI